MKLTCKLNSWELKTLTRIHEGQLEQIITTMKQYGVDPIEIDAALVNLLHADHKEAVFGDINYKFIYTK